MKLKKKKSFKVFIKEVEKWVNYFGFTDWDINVRRGKKKNFMAQCLVNSDGRSASILLHNMKAHRDLDDIRRSAFHEVCELLLHVYFEVIALKGIKKKQRFMLAERAGHVIINRLTNALFEKSLKEKQND